MVFVSFLIAFLLFVYDALSPILGYDIDSDFKVVSWGLAFVALGFLLPLAAVVSNNRRQRL